MRAVELRDTGPRFRDDYPAPAPTDGDVRVRVLQAGVCETDLQLIEGYMGFTGVPGHEFVGVVEEGRLAGERVVGEINCACHKCDWCQRGLSNHCPHRSVVGILNRDGAFADLLVLPEGNLHVVPEELSDDEATLVEPVAAACQIPTQVDLRPEQKVVVLGDGRLGNLCAQIIREVGCDVLVVGKHPRKLARLTHLGISTAVLTEAPADRSADVVVDCTGSQTGLDTALSMIRPRGTIVLKTTIAGVHQLSLAPVVIDEMTIVGSRCGPFAEAIEAIRSRRVRLDDFVSARYPLDEFDEALETARSPEALKVILEINGGGSS